MVLCYSSPSLDCVIDVIPKEKIALLLSGGRRQSLEPKDPLGAHLRVPLSQRPS